ncbi:hypothetical protein TL16_g12099 [Triparma laevis f. inornata]|uniref:BspA family leucine-rich repeat surface protein n=1 Tax=Triparma laevis f. inornata TaxID=1714386 RepID=A0A9W7EVG3_9STRA|nr:hypothetical protein TL16_g12099 [Triparma laevis f. inornata]
MERMFWLCNFFNCDLSAWNIAKVTNMKEMFFGASSFNRETIKEWSSGGGRRTCNFGLRQDSLARAANEVEGRRLAVCDEVCQGLCLNDEKFKKITGGGDTMAGTSNRVHPHEEEEESA